MPRCLIVDDHDDGRAGCQEYLQSFGLDVEATGTAEDALLALTKQPIDLVIVDLQLPGMDGWELIRQIRAMRDVAALPIVAVSACVFPEDRARAEEAGCDVFLTKPCLPDELLATIRRLLAAEAHR